VDGYKPLEEDAASIFKVEEVSKFGKVAGYVEVGGGK
jgi:hypothetical protein